jgi:hypothetical protein
MITIIGISVISMCKVIGPLLFFMSLLLMVWGGFRLIVTAYLRGAIITRYPVCGGLGICDLLRDTVQGGPLPLQLDR